MASERETSGRWIPSGNAANADRKADTNEPADPMDKARQVLEGLLRKGDQSPSEIRATVATLFTIYDRKAADNQTAKDHDNSNADLIDQMNDEERAFLGMKFDQLDAFYNRVRQRLGQPPVNHPAHPTPFQSFGDRLDYVLALINRRDEQFIRLVNDFVLEHPSLATVMDKDRTKEMERSVATHLIKMLDQVGLYNEFSERIEQQLVLGNPDGSIYTSLPR